MAVPFEWDFIHCDLCRIQVAFGDDVVTVVWPGGIFTRLFNVDNNVNLRQTRVGTVSATYCTRCGRMLGWKFIQVTQEHHLYRDGRFILLMDRLRYSRNEDHDGDITDLDEGGDSNDENAGQALGANRQNADQDGVITDLDDENADQDLGANGQNADQNGVANVQDLGANEQNVDQDLGANERNADEDVGGNQQVPNGQDLGANEENADQDGGGNEQPDDDEDGGPPRKRRRIN